jgi:predicted ATPase/DNA-binding NarL/FixJ family response regulator
VITLTGPGGIGKTRLAIEAASGARRAFRDGVWLAELGGLRDPALLVPEVARALGLSDRTARWAVAALADYLGDRCLLLVIDQCEHLADACAVMADALLRGCPGLHIIATSRHVLGVAGEVTIPVPPMSVPVGAAAPEELLGYEAVRLFADRAVAVLPGFRLDEGNGPAVAGICRRLDGIPLAVELAAVRLRSLSPAQVLSRLDSRFQLLSGGGPAGQPHHRTLQAALEWSYGLLSEAEQTMWRRVSVFAGSFDLDAAEAVCSGEGITPETVVDLVDALVAKSILVREGEGTARYRLLDTIGEFGLGKLRGQGSERGLRRRHRAWYAGLAARQEAFGPGRAEWIAALDADHENLRAALEFCLSEPQEIATGAEMACDLWRYWETHGHLTEGRRILAALLDQLGQDAPARPRALWVAGFLALLQTDIPSARALLENGLKAAEDTGDVQSVAYAPSQLGQLRHYLGEVDQGRALAARQSADQVGVALALTQIGYIDLSAGDLQAAAGQFGECARVCQASGNVWYHGVAQWGLAMATWLLGDPDRAAVLLCDSLRSLRLIDDPIGTAYSLDTLAWTAAAQNKPARALTLLAAADAAWAAISAAPQPALRRYHDAALAAARETLPEGTYRAAFAKGAAMSPAEATAFALGEPARPAPRAQGSRADVSPAQLSRREQEVAALVARGLSNGQIAGTLVISVRTVETLVQHIMDKLGVSSRAQIAAWAAGQPSAP